MRLSEHDKTSCVAFDQSNGGGFGVTVIRGGNPVGRDSKATTTLTGSVLTADDSAGTTVGVDSDDLVDSAVDVEGNEVVLTDVVAPVVGFEVDVVVVDVVVVVVAVIVTEPTFSGGGTTIAAVD